MDRIGSTHRRSIVTANQLVRLSAILFFCNLFIDGFFSYFLSEVGMQQYSNLITVFAIYFPLLLACILNPKKYIKSDSLLLFIGIALFFGLTLIIHMDYSEWYFRDNYGILDTVFNPLGGLFFYFFIRLEDHPKQLKEDWKIAGWLMYIYFLGQIFYANQRGYWYGISGNSDKVEFSYSMSFGYRVLTFTLVYLYDALKEKKWLDIVGAAIGIVMIMLYGSRGATLCIGVFFLLYWFISQRKQVSLKKRIASFLAGLVLLAIVYFLFDRLIQLIITLLSRLSVSSRTIAKFLEGTIASDSGRSHIWDVAKRMIAENPWGYGAFGTRPVLSRLIIAGHSHSIIYEMLIDFGVFIGGALLLFLFIHALLIIFRQENEWGELFIPFVSCASALFISLSFWEARQFWICLAIGVSYFQLEKEKQRRTDNGAIQDS